jgi:hypothetical protein
VQQVHTGTQACATKSAAGSVASSAAPMNMELDTAKIEQLTGQKGQMNDKEGVFKVSMPRKDLIVTVGSVKMSPAMGLTAWAAFKPMGDKVMVMGDMVMLEDQVNPVMSAALDNGLAVTALHNHFFWDQPRVMFMHIGGTGDVTAMATAVGKVFGKITETAGGKGEKAPTADIDPAKSTLDPKKIDAVLGVTGDFKDGVYKATFGRTTKMDGEDVGGTMGVNTWAALAGSDDVASIDGDFAIQENELQDVLKALRGAGIDIVAIHSHMTGDSPRILFLHYWGVGKTANLAKGVKTALDKTAR